ncbi:hypothetical protein CPB84DRAFT_1019583 [Gymnopilus junonius]|uniref:Uncharacterized protein n=1 Tax=Gymnopilus junonius TaxID=109634 RepID=A0A9P5NPG5_GYMJU|nr:hypothetical protein CPB84DRAFT_1019583 [Gymnopilus junonius]
MPIPILTLTLILISNPLLKPEQAYLHLCSYSHSQWKRQRLTASSPSQAVLPSNQNQNQKYLNQKHSNQKLDGAEEEEEKAIPSPSLIQTQKKALVLVLAWDTEMCEREMW